MINTITLIRHSKVDRYPHLTSDKWPLSDEGKRLAINLTIAIPRLQTIFSSPQVKAFETAEIIAQNVSTDIILRDGFTSVLGEGTGEIPNYSQIVEGFLTGKTDVINPGGETMEQVRERVSREIDCLESEYPGLEDIGIVTHGLVLAIFLASLYGKEPIQMHREIGMLDFTVIDWKSQTVLVPFGWVK